MGDFFVSGEENTIIAITTIKQKSRCDSFAVDDWPAMKKTPRRLERLSAGFLRSLWRLIIVVDETAG